MQKISIQKNGYLHPSSPSQKLIAKAFAKVEDVREADEYHAITWIEDALDANF